MWASVRGGVCVLCVLVGTVFSSEVVPERKDIDVQAGRDDGPLERRQLAATTYGITTDEPTTVTTLPQCGMCEGMSCDLQVDNFGLTCEYMEIDLGCDCSYCECPNDCFDVFDIENGEGSCAYYAENFFCNSFFCPTCQNAGQCDYSCSFNNCDTTTTTTTTAVETTTTTAAFVSTTRPLYFDLTYEASKTICNNIYKIATECNGGAPCTLRECWVRGLMSLPLLAFVVCRMVVDGPACADTT